MLGVSTAAMPQSFRITHVEATPSFTLYHLDAPKQGTTAIVFLRSAPVELEPTLATLHRQGVPFDFEIEPWASPPGDPRLRTACRIRALTVSPR